MGMKHWPDPDFLPRPRPAPFTAWSFALAGAVALAFAAREVGELRERIALQDAAKPAAIARIDSMRPSRSAVVEGAARHSAAGKEPGRTAAAAAGLAYRLNYPWQHLLPSIETATLPGIQWLSFEHDLAHPDTRLEGLAPDVDTALAVVKDLSNESAWSGVALVNVRTSESASGVPSVPALAFEVSGKFDRVAPPAHADGSR